MKKEKKLSMRQYAQFWVKKKNQKGFSKIKNVSQKSKMFYLHLKKVYANAERSANWTIPAFEDPKGQEMADTITSKIPQNTENMDENQVTEVASEILNMTDSLVEISSEISETLMKNIGSLTSAKITGEVKINLKYYLIQGAL